MAEGTWVGLDVHARKVVAGVLDAGSELRSLRAPTLPTETVGWLAGFPAPVRLSKLLLRQGLERLPGSRTVFCASSV